MEHPWQDKSGGRVYLNTAVSLQTKRLLDELARTVPSEERDGPPSYRELVERALWAFAQERGVI